MKNVTIHNRVLLSIASFLFIASGMLSAQAGQSYRQLTQKHPGWLQVPGALVPPTACTRSPKAQPSISRTTTEAATM